MTGLLEALGGQLRGQRRLGLGPCLPCLSLAGAPEPLGPPRYTGLPVEQGGEVGLLHGDANARLAVAERPRDMYQLHKKRLDAEWLIVAWHIMAYVSCIEQ